MNKVFFLCAFIPLFLSAAQEPKRITRTLSMDNAMIIREAGAAIVMKGDKLTVDIVFGNTEKQIIDIQKDDEVLMANGKKIKTIADLRESYAAAAVGAEYKLGIQRGEQLLIASFIKKSDEELNAGSGQGGMVMRMERKEGEEILPALGLAIVTQKDRVVVSAVLPTAEKNFTSFKPKKDDVIISINEKNISTAESFASAYDAFNEGDRITIRFSRNGKQQTAAFDKPKPAGRTMMITK